MASSRAQAPRNRLALNPPCHQSFDFVAELMASDGDNYPIEFRLDNSSIGVAGGGGFLTATTPPSVITVSDLAEGNHVLGVDSVGLRAPCVRCPGVTNHIRVVRLGVHSPGVRPDGARHFEVATSYAGKRHIIEASPDLVDWCVIATTNAPATNSFTFVVPGGGLPADRYYRVVVPEP